MKWFPSYVAIAVLTGCTIQAQQSQPAPVAQLKPVVLNQSTKIVEGQTVYVPVYSHIYMVERDRRMDLTVTLSVRNTDQSVPITIAAVNYHDTTGKLVRKYLEQPGELQPLAAVDFVVNQEDTSGGAGASFIVEWVAQKAATTPVIEAVMINTGGNQGVSFVTTGRVIKNRGNQK